MIELTDYTIAPERAGGGIRDLDFSLSKGEICLVRTDSHVDACTFLKALTTLLPPVKGSYRFGGDMLDLSDYRSLLPVKKKIGYIASDAAMISNKSIKENLLLMRQYHENSLDLSLEGIGETLCRRFQLDGILESRPGELTPSALKLAIAVRELTKSPELLLIEYPEDYIGLAHLDLFSTALGALPLSEMAVVFLSDDDNFIDMFANKHVTISEGHLRQE